MANSFFNFVTRFISGTTVKAGPINDRLTEVQSGFGLVETALKSALKIAGFSSTSAITATPNSLLQLDASGVPVASATLGFSPNMGAYRVQNVGAAVTGTDAPNYGQMTTYVNTIAFGSPNVLTVPAFAGNSLKALRLNAGETALEFGNQFSAPSLTDVTTLTASYGAASPSWLREGNNLCRTPNTWLVEGGATLELGEGDQAAQTIVRSYNFTPRTSGVLIARNVNESVCDINKIGTFTLSVAVKNTSTVGGFVLKIEWVGGAGGVLATNSQLFTGAMTTWRRVSFTGTNTLPSCGFVVSIVEAKFQDGELSIADVKLESGALATPFNTHHAVEVLGAQRAALKLDRERSLDAINYTNRYTSPPASNGTYWHLSGKNSGVIHDATIFCAGGTPGVPDDGVLNLNAKYIRAGRVMGYAAVFDNGATGTTKTIDWPANGAKQKATLNGNATITLTALDPSIVVDGLRLMLQKDATGTAFLPTFSSAATLKWKGNVVPEALTVASQEMEVIFWWDGGRFVGSWAKI